MQLARVIGDVVMTRKDANLEDALPIGKASTLKA